MLTCNASSAGINSRIVGDPSSIPRTVRPLTDETIASGLRVIQDLSLSLVPAFRAVELDRRRLQDRSTESNVDHFV